MDWCFCSHQTALMVTQVITVVITVAATKVTVNVLMVTKAMAAEVMTMTAVVCNSGLLAFLTIAHDVGL